MNTNYIINQSKKAAFIKHNEAIIKGYGEVLIIWDCVLYAAKEMNGKVFNKRFTEAVNEKAERYGRVFVSDPYGLGKEIAAFINSRCYTINGISTYIDKNLYYTDFKLSEILTDGRIDAKKAENVLLSISEKIMKRVAIIKDAVKNYDKHVKRRAKALAALAKEFEQLNELFKPNELHTYDWEKMLKYNDSI